MANAWIPILGGILFSAGIIGVLLVLETWIYDFGEDDVWEMGEDPPPDETDDSSPFLPEYDMEKLREDNPFLYELIKYMRGLRAYELREFAKAIKAHWKKLEGGGGVAIVGRAISYIPLDNAQSKDDREEIAREIIKAISGFWDVQRLNIFLEFYINLAVDLMGFKIPGPLDLIKYMAKIGNLSKLVRRIEQIQKIKSKVDRGLEMKKLKNDLETVGGDATKISGLIAPEDQTSTTKPNVGKLIGELVSSPGAVVSRFTPQAWAFLSISLVGLLSVIIFAAVGGFGKTTDSTSVGEDVGEVITGEESEIELAEPTITPAPTPTLSRLDIMLRFGNFTEEQKAQLAIAYLLDPEGDWVYSISTEIALQQLAQNDIVGYLAFWLHMSAAATNNWFNNSYFPCNQEIPGGRVVCPESAGDMPEGRILMLVMELAEPVPLADPDHFYTYAAVMDADGNPSNNFQYNPLYDWDYWQNTDLWYILDWIPQNQAWTVSALGENWEPIDSDARVVIYEDLVVFFIPAEDFTVEYPAFRLSAFGHDGSYQPEVSSGDVTGANPAEELIPVSMGEVLIED